MERLARTKEAGAARWLGHGLMDGRVVLLDTLIVHQMTLGWQRHECALAQRGVEQDGGSATVVVNSRAEMLDAPIVAQGDVGSTAARLGWTGMARGTQIDIAYEPLHIGIVAEMRRDGILLA